MNPLIYVAHEPILAHLPGNGVCGNQETSPRLSSTSAHIQQTPNLTQRHRNTCRPVPFELLILFLQPIRHPNSHSFHIE